MPCHHKPARVTFVADGRVKDRAHLCLTCDEVAPGEIGRCPRCGGLGRAPIPGVMSALHQQWSTCAMCHGAKVVYLLAGAGVTAHDPRALSVLGVMRLGMLEARGLEVVDRGELERLRRIEAAAAETVAKAHPNFTRRLAAALARTAATQAEDRGAR